jgi:glycosyltransferase involved in cell wall biosynthesis
MRLLGLPAEGGAVLLENFQLLRLARSLNPSAILFDYIDDAFGFTAMPDYVRDLWRETVTTASAVTVTAARLQEQVAALRPGPVSLVRNGVEYDRFAESTAARPTDLPPPGARIAGYVGSIYPWFDTELLAGAARRMPAVHFVLIGPTHPDIGPRLAALRTLPNVHLLGPRPYADVPAYVRHFQAGIIPFLRNTLTESVNPVKLYEYAAAGVPVVSTFFADDLEMFGRVIHIARDPEEFIQHLDAALEESGKPAITADLRRFARENDWSVRVEAILDLLGNRVKNTPPDRPIVT